MATGGSGISSKCEKVTCTICLELFRSPRLLPCHHTFCLDCLRDLASRHGNTSFPCPSCRKTATVPKGGVGEFQVNFYLEDDLMEVQKAASQQEHVSTDLSKIVKEKDQLKQRLHVLSKERDKLHKQQDKLHKRLKVKEKELQEARMKGVEKENEALQKESGSNMVSLMRKENSSMQVSTIQRLQEKFEQLEERERWPTQQYDSMLHSNNMQSETGSCFFMFPLIFAIIFIYLVICGCIRF